MDDGCNDTIQSGNSREGANCVKGLGIPSDQQPMAISHCPRDQHGRDSLMLLKGQLASKAAFLNAHLISDPLELPGTIDGVLSTAPQVSPRVL